jgi:hypothetical protein
VAVAVVAVRPRPISGVVRLAQIAAATPSIAGDRARIRTGLRKDRGHWKWSLQPRPHKIT